MRASVLNLAMVTILAAGFSAPYAHAQDTGAMPPMPAPTQASDSASANLVPAMQALPAEALDDNEPIKLSPDGPAVVQLSEDAASIIVGNPAHASALLENPRMLMLMPAVPGTTKIMALNREGKLIFNRHVLVGSGKSKYKRISRTCAASDKTDCKPVAVYYCPGKCYESVVTEEGAATQPSGDLASLPIESAATGQEQPAPATPDDTMAPGTTSEPELESEGTADTQTNAEPLSVEVAPAELSAAPVTEAPATETPATETPAAATPATGAQQ